MEPPSVSLLALPIAPGLGPPLCTKRFPHRVGIKCSVIKPAYNPYIIHISSIYKEYTEILIKIIGNTGAAFGGRPIGSVFLIVLTNIHGDSLYMDDIWMIYG